MDATTDRSGAKYLALMLGIDRRFPGYVGAYVGPPEVREAR